MDDICFYSPQLDCFDVKTSWTEWNHHQLTQYPFITSIYYNPPSPPYSIGRIYEKKGRSYLWRAKKQLIAVSLKFPWKKKGKQNECPLFSHFSNPLAVHMHLITPLYILHCALSLPLFFILKVSLTMILVVLLPVCKRITHWYYHVRF